MKRKLERALCYLKELFFMGLCKLLGLFCRAFLPQYRNLWLVAERGDDARDNGYWFYHYLRTEHPEINVRYVITDDSVDKPRIDALGGALRKGSFAHYLAYYCADVLAGSHVQPCAPDLMVHYHLAAKGIRARGKQVFLQHGVIKDEMQWLHRENLYLDQFLCGAKPEYEYIRDTFGFAPGVVQYTGLARFDNLIRASRPEKMVLVMPTWRGSHYPSGDAFPGTAFYRAYQSLLNSPKLAELLERYDYQLVFYPHIEMQRYNALFHTEDPRITIASKSTHDVQQLLMRCAVLITDYSSVYFDVAYLEKPELYYQFDEEEFQKYHYKKGYFDYRRDGFGRVCVEEPELLRELEGILAGGAVLDPVYRERVARFFPLRDAENCTRIFKTIQGLR